MAYLQRSDPAGRATAIAGVVTVHAALAVALLTGLKVGGHIDHKPRFTSETFIPVPPPPPPEPEAPARTRQQRAHPLAPVPPQTLPTNSSVIVERWNEGDIPEATNPGLDGTAELARPVPTPSPSFAPKGVVPRGSPGNWITTEDYPSGPLRRRAEGLTRYQLVVSSAGKVTACQVTLTSGSAELDRETCRLLSRRATFEPATDGSGSQVVGTYSGSVKWEIPD